MNIRHIKFQKQPVEAGIIHADGEIDTIIVVIRMRTRIPKVSEVK